MKWYHSLALFVLFFYNCPEGWAQKDLLQSGPMVGYSEMREVMLWVQTKESAEVEIHYWDRNKPEKVFRTLPVITGRQNAFTAKLLADKVLPGILYDYILVINDQTIELPYPLYFKSRELWHWRKDAPDFTFVAGSCSYISEERFDRPGKPYGGDYHIFHSIDSLHPEMMLWLGDNIYLREADWNTKTGIYHRYTHTRSTPEMQSLLAHTHNYAIWDDHDFGPNDADGSFIHKDMTTQAFEDFWANPSYGINGKPGTTSQFPFSDCSFFLLDNRYYRSSRFDSVQRQILGKEQIDWLIGALNNSRATFKLVAIGGQVLNSAKTYENYANFPEEREYLLRRIREENIKGVIFLSGDRHHGEISMLALNEDNVIYDITSSPLTSRAHKNLKEDNDNRVKKSLIKQRHFTHFSITGKRGKRIMEITFYSSKGKKLFNYSISQPDY